MTRPCKYGCGTELGAFDEENRKYLEAASGGLHTKERCQEAKAKLESKNDHGNEEFKYLTPEGKRQLEQIQERNREGKIQLEERNKQFVDHTLKPELSLKTLTDPTPEGIDLKYNNFKKERTIRFSQSHVQGSQYTVYVWYEEKE